MKLAEVSVKRPVFAIMMTAALIVDGSAGGSASATSEGDSGRWGRNLIGAPSVRWATTATVPATDTSQPRKCLRGVTRVSPQKEARCSGLRRLAGGE